MIIVWRSHSPEPFLVILSSLSELWYNLHLVSELRSDYLAIRPDGYGVLATLS